MELNKMLGPYSGLPKSIYVIFFARIINSMGSFVFPLLTMLLTGKIGLNEREAGIFVTLASLSYLPGAVIGGKLSDVIGRKRVLVVFQATAALSFIPCAFLGHSIIIPWILIFSGMMNGAAQPASSAMIADLTTPDNRKEAYSLLYLGINIGFSVGPLVAGFLYNNYLELLFLGNATSMLLSLLLVLKFVPETKPTNEYMETSQETISEEERAESGGLFSVLLRRPIILAFAILSSIYSFAYSQGNFSTTIQLQSIFGKDSASQIVGTIYSTNGIVVITMTTLIVYLTKKFKPIFNISLAGVFFAVGFGIQYFIHSIPMFIFATVVWTIGEILNATNSGVYIANHAPMSHRGRFNSLISMITGAGSALGPLVMGGFIQDHGVRNVWPVVFCITMTAAVLLYALYFIEKSKNKTVSVKQ